ALGTFRTLLANEFFCTTEEIANLEAIYNFKLETLESFITRYLAV
ncbi:MAG: SDR family NAD(P)-dependent oxidoreductase, partial [Hassallia sp.]